MTSTKSDTPRTVWRRAAGDAQAGAHKQVFSTVDRGVGIRLSRVNLISGMGKRYYQVLVTLPRLLTADEAEDYVAGPIMMATLIAEHGIRPVTRRRGLVVYDRFEIDLAIERIKQAACRDDKR